MDPWSKNYKYLSISRCAGIQVCWRAGVRASRRPGVLACWRPGVLVSGYRGIQVCCGWMSLNSTFKTPGEDTQPRPRQALPLPLAPFT